MPENNVKDPDFTNIFTYSYTHIKKNIYTYIHTYILMNMAHERGIYSVHTPTNTPSFGKHQHYVAFRSHNHSSIWGMLRNHTGSGDQFCRERVFWHGKNCEKGAFFFI